METVELTTRERTSPRNSPNGAGRRRSPAGARRESEKLRAEVGPLPIAVSIIGHRDPRPEDLGTIEGLVRSILVDLQSRFPHSPLLVLSALADGADRIGAKIALELGARLVVPLPMPRAIYEMDFSETSRREFGELLDRADQWFELPLLPGVSEEEISVYGPPRDRQYAYVGAYLARHSQFIVALWDGVPINLVGGTAFVVDFQLKGIPPPYIQQQGRFDPEETGPVYHVVTPRVSNPSPVGTACTLVKIYPDTFESTEAAEAAFEAILRNTDGFNRDTISLRDKLREERAKSREGLVPTEVEEELTGEMADTVELYSIADSLAIHNRRMTDFTLRLIFAIALVAVGAFDLYLYFLMSNPSVLTVFFGTLAIAYGVYKLAGRNRYQHKHLDYRALTEGLRVQFFWRLAGIRESVADYYIGEQRSELDWIRHALRIWSIPKGSRGERLEIAEPPSLVEHWPVILKDWVASQYSYFAESSRREDGKMKRMQLWGHIFFLAGLAIAAVNVIYQISAHDEPIARLLLAGSIAPIIAGLLVGYAHLLALSDHARQYERMANLFAHAKMELKTLLWETNRGEAQRLVRDLGKEALNENGHWVLTHRERPIQVPKA